MGPSAPSAPELMNTCGWALGRSRSSLNMTTLVLGGHSLPYLRPQWTCLLKSYKAGHGQVNNRHLRSSISTPSTVREKGDVCLKPRNKGSGHYSLYGSVYRTASGWLPREFPRQVIQELFFPSRSALMSLSPITPKFWFSH